MQTKRLHISGLTPAISEKDLDSRFSVFGTVKAVHGFGQLNALGQPRNFAFLSLEATPEKLSKCLNVLSGSTWKGTKLRIGDARPDYEQKLQMERIEPARPSKRRRLAQGVESKDMSLVTLENVEERSGWKKTSLSHLVRPLRMRPLHPIPHPVVSQSLPSGKLKKRKVSVPTRARRRKIDPTLYDTVHLTEGMLQADHVVVPPAVVSEKVISKKYPAKNAVDPPAVDKKKVTKEPRKDMDEDIADLFQAEKQKDLSLLALMFDGKDKWEGKEDDLEDVDMGDAALNGREAPDSESEGEPREASSDEEESHGKDASPALPPSPPAEAHTTRLKDLFASATAEPVSILHGLDLDLEDDFAFESTMNTEPPSDRQVDAKRPSATDDQLQIRRKEVEQAQFSSTAPYFFPLLPHERSRGTLKDLMAISAANGWMRPLLHPIPPEEARKQWESQKLALTRDWKQRHREASKKQRKGTAINDLE